MVQAERPRGILSTAGFSDPFVTSTEAPTEIQDLRLVRPPSVSEIRIAWDPPLDNGGVALVEYEVILTADTGLAKTVRTEACHCSFSGLAPNLPVKAFVCAQNASGIRSPQVV